MTIKPRQNKPKSAYASYTWKSRPAPKVFRRMITSKASAARTSPLLVRPFTAVELSQIPDPYIPDHTLHTIPQGADIDVVPSLQGTGMSADPFDARIFIDWHIAQFGSPPVWTTFTVGTKKNPDGRLFKAAAAIGTTQRGNCPTRIVEMVTPTRANRRPRCQLRSVFPSKLIGSVKVLVSDRNTHLPLLS